MEHEPGQHLDTRTGRESFVRECYIELFRWFCRLTGLTDRAADLTQDTFAAFWQAQGRSPAGVSPRTWLFAIGRNLWRKQARDRKSFEPAELVDLTSGAPAPEQVLQAREFQEAARRAVSELPEELREAFPLRFWQEFSYEQIGAIQEVSADLARWCYLAARCRLYEKLSAWDPGREGRRSSDKLVGVVVNTAAGSFAGTWPSTSSRPGPPSYPASAASSATRADPEQPGVRGRF